jgi:hypothetical protein
MIVGFTGAAATGKSWVAAKVAALLGFHYQGSRASEVAADTGFDVNAPHTFAERLEYQNEVLNRMKSDLASGLDHIVFDRTPIDLMAYALIAANDEVDTPEYKEYIDRCMELAVDSFDVIVLVSPAAKELYGEGELKPGRLCAKVHGYEHRVLYDHVIKILLANKKIAHKVIVIPEDCHYEDRVTFVKDKLSAFRTTTVGNTGSM